MITRSQISHVYRFLSQIFSPPTICIIGGYHGVNLGDMALGVAVKYRLKRKNINSGLQTIYNLDQWKWRKGNYAIIGGGAVGYNDSLQKVANLYNDSYDKVALLGVDFNDKDYSSGVLDLLKTANWISCRNKDQAENIKRLTKRNDVIFHPDLAFSLYPEFCLKQRENEKKKILLINVVLLYSSIEKGLLTPIDNYKKERPELYKNFDTMQKSYRAMARKVVKDSIKEGYEIETIPFTPGDVSAAKILLAGLDVKHNSYFDSPNKMIKKMASAGKRVFATRYHATIFAIKVGAETIPMAYAKKNELLLQEFGVLRNQFVSSADLANGNWDNLMYLNFNKKTVAHWERDSINIIDTCIQKSVGVLD